MACRLCVSNLDLAAIADSGQCFRWRELRPGEFRIVVFGRVLHARQSAAAGEVWLDCTKREFEEIWKNYFDLETDYQAIIRSIPETDTYLRNAAEYGRGIRILRQEPWETLITFLLSQRKNIPAIRLAVEKICEAAGTLIAEEDGERIYAFPSAKALAELSSAELLKCGLGYRAKYIFSAAQLFGREGRSMETLAAQDDAALFQTLCGLYGVGRKIALCTMLFGFHRMNAFPMDVWMHRVRERHYPQGIPTALYRPWAGVMQQYMFAYERQRSVDGKRGK